MGTSTIQTRAKYFLIVPYVLREAVDGRYGKDVNRVLRAIDSAEKDCGISFSRICLRNMAFREKTLKQYILMSIQNMKAIRTEIRAGSEDLKVISTITT